MRFGGRVFAPSEPNWIERIKMNPPQKSNKFVSRIPMKTLILLRVALSLILLGLTASVGLCDSEVVVGSSQPVTAFRVNSFLGWTIKLRNDSDSTYTAVFSINGWADSKAVPAHSTVKAGYVLGREVPTFHFAPKIGGLKHQAVILTE